MEQKKSANKESSQQRGERVQESSGNGEVDTGDSPPTRPSLAPHLEKFAKAVAEGHSHVNAAEICGRARGSASYLYAQAGVQERITELRRIAKNATEKAISENATMELRAISISRNDIINGLADIGQKGKSEIARVRAFAVLADIFLLRAKNFRDVGDFDGWTATELDEWVKHDIVPERFRQAFSQSAGQAQGPTASFRTEKH